MKLFPSFTRNNCSTLISFCRHNELLNSGFLKSNYLLSTTVRDIESQSSNDWPFKVPFRKSKMLMVVASRCERLKSPPFLAVIQTKKVQVYSDFFFGMSGNFVQICFVVDEPVMRGPVAKCSSISATC